MVKSLDMISSTDLKVIDLLIILSQHHWCRSGKGSTIELEKSSFIMIWTWLNLMSSRGQLIKHLQGV